MKQYLSMLSAAVVIGAITLVHSERPKLYAILAFPSAIGLRVNSVHNTFSYKNLY